MQISHLAVALPDSPEQVKKEHLSLQRHQVAVEEAGAAMEWLPLADKGGSHG